MRNRSLFGPLAAAACAALLSTRPAARAADYTLADLNDADTLERSLFVCLWRTGHGAPEGEPSPVVCTTAAISTDEAVRAKIRFNDDFLAFQARQQHKPELAQLLLPQAAKLPADDWRVLLVRELTARARYGKSVPPIK